jgi:hypothetical protein
MISAFQSLTRYKELTKGGAFSASLLPRTRRNLGPAPGGEHRY